MQQRSNTSAHMFGLVMAVAAVALSSLVYYQTKSILHERMRSDIRSMVSLGALRFKDEDIAEIIANEDTLGELITKVHAGTQVAFDAEKVAEKIKSEPELYNNPIVSVTMQMKELRDNSENIRYVYMWRKTEDPNTVAFVTDSDMVYLVDWDGNGKINDVDIPPMPGEPYDVTDLPLLRGDGEAFRHPAVEEDYLIDKWGTFISGFAPIQDAEGKTVAVIGMDIEISDFQRVVIQFLLPIAAMVGVLLLFFIAFRIVRGRQKKA